MRTTVTSRCLRRKRAGDGLDWARRCVLAPAEFGATDRERDMIAALLAQAVSAR